MKLVKRRSTVYSPAAYRRRWVLVGDVQQLPPFLEASEMMTNLEMMTDDQEKIHNRPQRACLLLRNIIRYQSPKSGHPIIMVEGDKVPQAFINEVNAKRTRCLTKQTFVLLAQREVNQSMQESNFLLQKTFKHQNWLTWFFREQHRHHRCKLLSFSCRLSASSQHHSKRDHCYPRGH